MVITHMEADVPEVWGMFRTLLNPKMPFYANHGQDCVPPPPPRYDSDSDSEAAATGTAPWMKAGDTINMNLGGSLIKAKVLELSPTNTEVNLSFVELGATQWLSVDDERLTPLDAEHPTTAAPDAATDAAAAAAEAEAEEDPEKAAELARQRAEFEAREAVWRNKLAVGRLVDVVDTAKSWYQAVVVDEKEPEADAADADASATESKGEPATAAGEPGEPGDDTADGTAEEKSEAKCTERQVKISFLGWPCAYDEWLPVSSRRMAELNTRSQGRRGNGAVVVALTDQQLEVDDDNDPEDAVAVVRWRERDVCAAVRRHARDEAAMTTDPPLEVATPGGLACVVRFLPGLRWVARTAAAYGAPHAYQRGADSHVRSRRHRGSVHEAIRDAVAGAHHPRLPEAAHKHVSRYGARAGAGHGERLRAVLPLAGPAHHERGGHGSPRGAP